MNAPISLARRRFALLGAAALASALALARGAAKAAISPAGRTTLVIGMVTADPKRAYQRLKPIAEYVAGAMEGLGVTGGDVVLAENSRQMMALLRQGSVDWVTETVFSALLLAEGDLADVLLRRWKDGVADYRTYLFTRQDSDIREPRDLVGRTIAFEDRTSTSAYFVPAACCVTRAST